MVEVIKAKDFCSLIGGKLNEDGVCEVEINNIIESEGIVSVQINRDYYLEFKSWDPEYEMYITPDVEIYSPERKNLDLMKTRLHIERSRLIRLGKTDEAKKVDEEIKKILSELEKYKLM